MDQRKERGRVGPARKGGGSTIKSDSSNAMWAEVAVGAGEGGGGGG